mgnify:CR=1 FL=1
MGWIREYFSKNKDGITIDVNNTINPSAFLPLLKAGGHVAVNLHGRGPLSHELLLATRPDHPQGRLLLEKLRE